MLRKNDQKSMQDERDAGNFERALVRLPEHDPKQDDANKIIEAGKKQEDDRAWRENINR